MTTKKDFKRHIRARQAKTGEAYTTARTHILNARDSGSEGPASSKEHITAIVLKCNEQSLRVRILDQEADITLRTSAYSAMGVAPGQFIEATLTKRWSWRGGDYASGAVERAWIDIPALGLDPLRLADQGVYDLDAMHDPFEPPDPYAKMWERFASTPRHAFEFAGIAWGAGVGVDPEDHGACLVSEAAEIGGYNRPAARELLMKALFADLRCIDAHSHLGNLIFDHRPEDAVNHYRIAIGIGELSLDSSFDGLLPWGYMNNRPLLRALHGYGLCLWRLDETEKALAVFERVLSLNPADHQGVRFCWDDIRNGRPWSSDVYDDA